MAWQPPHVLYGQYDSGHGFIPYKVAHRAAASSRLDAIATHATTAYLHLGLLVPGREKQLLKFTRLLRKVGGLAVKIESSGIAHEWDAWRNC